MTWLLDTLVWTGILIALVLVIRRPATRHFGARTAYALWSLPFLRLLMPPLVLPAPKLASAAVTAGDIQVAAGSDAAGEAALPLDAAIAASPDWLPALEVVLVSAWLSGAVLYFVLRLAAYYRLRAQLLTDAIAVGEAGAVRLVETPATRSPLAFGVFDKVVALPVGFMAMPDRVSRDLALAHELSHHDARDLAANFAALPLFALHWFNPLSWLGWRAMRRDQEAACDARVLEGRDRRERARYAAIIAGAAADPGPRVALAAPMACPVLGDKSIIHRLRSLTMNELSARRRRIGAALVGLAALALPLTASISYANASDAADSGPSVAPPVPPAPPAAPAAPEAPPAPPAPPALVGQAGDGHRVMIIRSEDAKDIDAEHRTLVVRTADGKVIGPDSPEFEARMKELEKHLAELDGQIERSVKVDDKRIREIEIRARAAGERAAGAEARLAGNMARIEMSCDEDDKAVEQRTEDGRKVIRICRKVITASALSGLKSARAAIAGDTRMNAETRREVLEDLDREIDRLERKPNG